MNSPTTAATESRFVYVTYIKTTPERLWSALIDPEFTQQYWLGARPEAEWKVGGAWKIVYPNGRIMDTGEILEFVPPKRLAIKWRNEWMPELKAEGWSLCTMEVEPAAGEAVKLTVTHSIERADSKLIRAVSGGWPQILSNLKTLLETGAVALPPKEFKA
ncbi:MAG TPA: SRPBCC family protein [Dongiaceae bacterium]|nr:SRPBCC family protein [Dongiaceae bacterium]